MALTKSFVQNAASTPVDGRFMLAGMLQKKADNTVRVGQLWGGSADVTATTASAPMTVQIAGGSSWALSRGYSDGAVIVANNGGATVNITDAPNANSRYDVVWMRHNDSTVGDADSNPVFGVTTGTAAASPTVPTAPSGALALATVLVPAGVTTTSASGVTITNVYPFTAVSGAPVRYRSVADMRADATNAVDGMQGYVKGGGLYWMRSGVWAREDAQVFAQVSASNTLVSGTTLITMGTSNGTSLATYTSDSSLLTISGAGAGIAATYAGWYEVSNAVNWGGAPAGERFVEITSSTTSISPVRVSDRRPVGTPSGASGDSAIGATLVHLNAGEVVNARAWQNSGSTIAYAYRLGVKLVALD